MGAGRKRKSKDTIQGKWKVRMKKHKEMKEAHRKLRRAKREKQISNQNASNN